MNTVLKRFRPLKKKNQKSDVINLTAKMNEISSKTISPIKIEN
jgi:hypothetical protein